MNCKNCNTDLHPYYQKKYDGYCLDCINAGAAEKEERIASMERQLAAAERLYLATLDYLNAWEDTDELESELKDALNDYANAKGEK